MRYQKDTHDEREERHMAYAGDNRNRDTYDNDEHGYDRYDKNNEERDIDEHNYKSCDNRGECRQNKCRHSNHNGYKHEYDATAACGNNTHRHECDESTQQRHEKRHSNCACHTQHHLNEDKRAGTTYQQDVHNKCKERHSAYAGNHRRLKRYQRTNTQDA